MRTPDKVLIMILLTALILPLAVAASEVEGNLTYQGNKARVAVGTIKAKTDECSWDMAAAIGEMLSTALANTGRFILLASAEETAELAEEIDFAQSGYAEQGSGPEKGLMESADLLVTGAVTSFEPDAGGSGGGLGGFKKKAFGKVGLKTKKAKLEMELKLIDIRTRRVLKAKTIKAESSKWAVDMNGGGWANDVALAGGLGVYSNEPMEKAVRAALAKSVEMISKEVPKEYYRYQGKGQYSQEYRKDGGATPAAATAGGGASTSSASRASQTSAAASATATVAEDMTLYTRYDFIPGNNVLFYDDLKGEEEGEFPWRWNLDNGVWEIARMNREYWILCTNTGSIRPKIPEGPLPEKYTVELEFYYNGPEVSDSRLNVRWVNTNGNNIGCFGYQLHGKTWLDLQGNNLANKSVPNKLTKGIHTMRIMATTRSIKCYLDNMRMANVPKVDGFEPVGFRISCSPTTDQKSPCLIHSFRFAEGGKTMREQLDETGKIVTHGILFDSGSATIKGGSFKTLQQISRLLEDDPDLRLSVEGHTDSDGADDANLKLSQDRARAVCAYLSREYGIAGDRLESKGRGESAPIGSNSSAEGKANNRRVELLKI